MDLENCIWHSRGFQDLLMRYQFFHQFKCLVDLICILLVIPLVISFRYYLVSYCAGWWIQYQWSHKQFYLFIPFTWLCNMCSCNVILYFTYCRYFTHFTLPSVNDWVVELMKVSPSLFATVSLRLALALWGLPFKGVSLSLTPHSVGHKRLNIWMARKCRCIEMMATLLGLLWLNSNSLLC